MNGDLSEHVVVIGLGYVGLPLAIALAGHYRVTGLDSTHAYDMAFAAVPHTAYSTLDDKKLAALVAKGGLLADLRSLFSDPTLPAGIDRWTL